MSICILYIGWNTDVISPDSKCLSPVTCLWKKTSHIETARTFSKNLQTPMLEMDINEKEHSHPTDKERTAILNSTL